jgi:transcriptional regulator with XRE-family HTH domain
MRTAGPGLSRGGGTTTFGVGGRIKTARQAKGLTQKELAAECRVPLSTIGAIEVGTSGPTAVLLRDLCDVLDVSADVILGRRPA